MTSDEQSLLERIRSDPGDLALRLVYEDWLEERGDARAELLKLQRAIAELDPDHVQWTSHEHRISELSRGLDAQWLALCALPHRKGRRLLRDAQDTCSPGWKRMLDLIDQAADDGRTTFHPSQEMDREQWEKLRTLPASIAKLTKVERLTLYGSTLVRLPPEIGEMASLIEFFPYTSYRLHWFPYEITRCRNLRKSSVSTRALYGNHKYRAEFPQLKPPKLAEGIAAAERSCSVCSRRFEDRGEHRVWISLRVATDVLPLLVNACSDACIGALPQPPPGYVSEPHRGGPNVKQSRQS
jgi:uncharacterized protein (TIGR02996 family)